jgi:hypothetical protein
MMSSRYNYAYIAPTIAAYRADGLGYLAIAKRLNDDALIGTRE